MQPKSFVDVKGMSREEIMTRNGNSLSFVSWRVVALLMLSAVVGCSQAPKSTSKKLQPGQEFSGFLGDYSGLTPNPALEGEVLTYVNPDKMKSLKRYVAMIVDPVEVYVVSDADESLIPERAREVVANYFRHALVGAVADAFPVVDSPGPLVLRLRSAIVGIDSGEVAPLELPAATEKPLERAIVLEEVGVEIELLDSETGERIAAAVDRENLGAGTEVGAENFSRLERFNQAKEAFDEWAERVRAFLDAEHELTGEDAERADKAYSPYAP